MEGNEYGPPLRTRLRNGRIVSNGSIGAYVRGKERARAQSTAARRRNIAVLDFETDPFDNQTAEPVYPFLVVVYSSEFPTITIWDNDWRRLVQRLFDALDELQEEFTIYAHNGGRFDYMYLMHLIDGRVKFKGRALMSAKFGKHELRDSLHIIPESLRNANRKVDIDYKLMHKSLREKHRNVIIDYCLEDCIATFEIVRAFIDKFGMPMTIGQAAMAELKKHYSFGRLTDNTDAYMRQWFFGGRVECIEGAGIYRGDYKLYDVNSMYPSVMAFEKHPITNGYFVNDRITNNTAFIHLHCENDGAFLHRTETGELTSEITSGEFFTTIHEYKMAKELGLIANERVIKTVDFAVWSTFYDFVMPLYDEREKLKRVLASDPNHVNRKSIEQEIKFLKYLLNNAYGKFAQNPRRFKEYLLTAPNEKPESEWLYLGDEREAERLKTEGPEHVKLEHVRQMRRIPEEETEHYTIWARPAGEWRFNNVATAASITGAARAKFIKARHYAVDPLYGDTDSLVCRALPHHELDTAKLGTWKLETEISEFILAGKKLYGYRTPDGKEVIRSKGAQGVTWAKLEAIVGGATVRTTMFGPTLARDQTQRYMTRDLRATA